MWNNNTKAFVTWNDKFVHVWNPHTQELIYHVDYFTETKSHFITTLSYSHANFLYILISKDFKVHIFNESLILIRELSLGHRTLTYSYFLDSSNVLIASGVEGTFLYKLVYNGAVEK